MMTVPLYLLLLCWCSWLAVSQPPPCCLKVNTTTKHIVDVTGRQLLFHGMNAVYKTHPYYPRLDSFDPELSLSQEDISFFVKNGFNVVRLYVAWQGVEPTKGQYNDTYLSVLADIVNNLGQVGIYTILDCHQDLLSPKFCGEGAPDYAALYTNRSKKPLPFPEPIPQLSPFTVDNSTGYPFRNDCSRHQFFTYYFSDAEGKAWQSLYDNEAGIRDRMGLFWTRVAERFAGNPYILGYELINEPWAGDIYGHPDQLEAHVADRRNLEPLYQSLHSAIRQVDNDHIILFEPTVIITNLPLKSISSTGLTQGPGGAEFNDRQVLSYHLYCILLDKDGQPRNGLLCDELDKNVFNIRQSDRENLGVAGFMTEWGAYTSASPRDNAWKEAVELLALADSNFQSWTYWQYKGYGDITTQSNTGEGLWYKNGSIDHDKLKLLSRTYAQAVSGQALSQSFDPKTSSYTISYMANKSIPNPTEIYINEEIQYPNGYTVVIQPSGAATVAYDSNKVFVTLSDSAPDKQVVTVRITQK